jgi:adenylosuccinate synthase
MKQAYTFTDLGLGENGKGGAVEKTCVLKQAHTVLKSGGAQGNHGVELPSGKKFGFSQFGCGTFYGAKTHITELMVIEPYKLIMEGRQLQEEFGLTNIFDRITIDGQALCITPFHTITSQLRELDRKNNPKGTVGLGAGEAKLDSEKYPELAIYAKDLNAASLLIKLQAVKTQKLNDLQEIIERVPNFLATDQKHAQELLNLLNDSDFINRIVDWFKALTSLVKIVDRDYLRHILQQDGTVVFENYHGVLADRYYGFVPHVTSLRTNPNFIWDLINDCDYDGQVIKIAVTRAYQIRHGAGPMVSESPEWLEKMLPSSSQEDNRWQGKVRVGPLDLISLKYALEVCGGPSTFDGLALTWFDQIQAIGQWPICHSYQGASDADFFSETGQIKIKHLACAEQLIRQKELTERLFKCLPNVHTYNLTGLSQPEIINLATGFTKQNLGLPLKMISFGPTVTDKICL